MQSLCRFRTLPGRIENRFPCAKSLHCYCFPLQHEHAWCTGSGIWRGCSFWLSGIQVPISSVGLAPSEVCSQLQSALLKSHTDSTMELIDWEWCSKDIISIHAAGRVFPGVSSCWSHKGRGRGSGIEMFLTSQSIFRALDAETEPALALGIVQQLPRVANAEG